MFDDVIHDVKVHVENFVSATMGELVKELLTGIEMRFQEEHVALVEAINAFTSAAKAQTTRLHTLCNDAHSINEKMDVLCSQTAALENINRDVATITNSVRGVENNTDTISSFILSLNEGIDDIRLVFQHKANEIRKMEEERRLAELKE